MRAYPIIRQTIQRDLIPKVGLCTKLFRKRLPSIRRPRDNSNKSTANMNTAKPGPGDDKVPKSNWIDLTPKKMLKDNQTPTSKYCFLVIGYLLIRF